MFARLRNCERVISDTYVTSRKIHTGNTICKNTRAGVVRRTRDQSHPLTYEQAKKPHQIGLMKSWNSWNTSNLEGEDRYTSEVTLHDQFIRTFINGTFPLLVQSEVSLPVGSRTPISASTIRIIYFKHTWFIYKPTRPHHTKIKMTFVQDQAQEWL
ncbi:unnamed protein product [Schistosoma mattheei]|uniref:Uncharacterized protein n=1 Tax=Schistosoma mattheei TaxID=31246 RepID=A0A183NJ65_9TREM|nr:unnamed protein product [Schistosoma mattheei]